MMWQYKIWFWSDFNTCSWHKLIIHSSTHQAVQSSKSCSVTISMLGRSCFDNLDTVTGGSELRRSGPMKLVLSGATTTHETHCTCQVSIYGTLLATWVSKGEYFFHGQAGSISKAQRASYLSSMNGGRSIDAPWDWVEFLLWHRWKTNL